MNDVTGSMLDRKRWIRGVVTSVGDGGECSDIVPTPLDLACRSLELNTKAWMESAAALQY